MKLTQSLCIAFLSVASATPFNLRRRAVCSSAQLEEFACDLNDGTLGSLVCRHGFTACIHEEDHLADDTCGCCQGEVETYHPACPDEEPRGEEPEDDESAPVLPTGPLCSAVDLDDFSCTKTADGKPGALVCNVGFTACLPLEEIEDDFTCGCCPGDNSPRCLETAEARTTGLAMAAESLVCSVSQMENYQCVLNDGSDGAMVCRHGFTACLHPEDHEDDDVCGCCYGDANYHPSCKDASPEVEEGKGLLETLTTSEGDVCSALEEVSVGCMLGNSTDMGVYVCRGNTTTCMESTGPLLATDSCGCCPGDNNTMCMEAEPELVTEPDMACTEARIAEFDCALGDGSTGVYVCKHGFTSCVPTDTLLASDSCGCCVGDDHDGCAFTQDANVVVARKGNPDLDFP